MKLTSITTTFTTVALAATQVSAWSAIGHEIVATIAQAHLTPSTLAAIKPILPTYAEGHLAPIAAWADSIRFAHRETAGLHYVNAIGDDPADTCLFGEKGWVDGERNLVKAVGNYSKRVMDGEGDIPLRFLVHFLGDIHQPLHLAGKLRGGNGAIVKFEGRRASLHSAWDGLLIQKSIREMENYTSPLPNKRIEAALRGKTYDPFVRFIIAEGINGFWSDAAISDWPACPLPSSYDNPTPKATNNPHQNPVSLGSLLSSDAEAEFAEAHPDLTKEELAALQKPARINEKAKHVQLEQPAALPLLLSLFGMPTPIISLLPRSWLERPKTWIGELPDQQEREGKVPGCAFHWAKEMHQLNCDVVWPKHFEAGMELDTPEYWGKVKGDLIVEKQLAKGGIRLAAILNSIFDPALQGRMEIARS